MGGRHQTTARTIGRTTASGGCGPAEWLPLAINFEHAAALPSLPALHRDPFDRLLVAVALTEGLVLVTADELVLQYPVSCIDARRAG